MVMSDLYKITAKRFRKGKSFSNTNKQTIISILGHSFVQPSTYSIKILWQLLLDRAGIHTLSIKPMSANLNGKGTHAVAPKGKQPKRFLEKSVNKFFLPTAHGATHEISTCHTGCHIIGFFYSWTPGEEIPNSVREASEEPGKTDRPHDLHVWFSSRLNLWYVY